MAEERKIYRCPHCRKYFFADEAENFAPKREGYLSLAEVAEKVKVDLNTLQRWLATSKVPWSYRLVDGFYLSESAFREVFSLAEGDELLTPEEAANLLGVSTPTIYRWVKEGRLEPWADWALPVLRFSKNQVLRVKEKERG